MDQLKLNPQEKINKYLEFSGMVYQPIDIQNTTLSNNPLLKDSKLFNLLKPEEFSFAIYPPSEAQEAVETPSEQRPFIDPLIDSISKIKQNNEVEIDTTVDSRTKSSTSQYVPRQESELESEFDSTRSNDDVEALRKLIISKEAGPQGYKSFNPNSGKGGTKGSGAWGAYQFIWSHHKNKIKEVTGINKPQDFLNNSHAQDAYFNHWYENVLKPAKDEFKKNNPNSGLSDIQILDGMHFRGVSNFNQQYKDGTFNKRTENNNPSLNERLGLK